MPLDPRIPLMGQPMPLQSPMNALAKAMQIQNMGQHNVLQGMELQAAQAQLRLFLRRYVGNPQHQ